MLLHEDLTEQIIGAAIAVHRELGPGLLESAYAACLCREMALGGLRVRKEVDVPVMYKGVQLDCGYRLDLVVNDAVVVEVKAIDRLEAIHEAQLITYLRLTGMQVGLLINFNVAVLKDGVTRRVLETAAISPRSPRLRGE